MKGTGYESYHGAQQRPGCDVATVYRPTVAADFSRNVF